MKRKVILASSSPRRAALLNDAGVEFDIVKPDIDETPDPALTPEENARFIALRKAEAVAQTVREGVVLAADTMVVIDHEIIGKPVDATDARKMLQRIAGREHKVVTGVSIICEGSRRRWAHVEVSFVRFKPVADGDIEAYVNTGEPLDKAGAYAIQGGAAGWIDGYSGSLTNIIGLPMEQVACALESMGVKVSRGRWGACR
ncbi:MAG: septum formation protein Maf [Nitrospinae bacterium]|nr:septum formation protein Maf [Nitrospinota bacterium]